MSINNLLIYLILIILLYCIFNKTFKFKYIENMTNNIYYLSTFKDLDFNVKINNSIKDEIMMKMVDKYENLNIDVNNVLVNSLFAVLLNNKTINLLGYDDNKNILLYSNNIFNKIIDTKINSNINILTDSTLILGNNNSLDLNTKVRLENILVDNTDIFMIIKDDNGTHEITSTNIIHNDYYIGDNPQTNNYYIIKSI